MKDKKELTKKLVHSFRNEPDKWDFDEYTATHLDWRINIWIADMLYIRIMKPTIIGFSILQKIKLKRGINNCKTNKILNTIK